MLYLTSEQHREVLRRLVDLCRGSVEQIPFHSEGVGYTSLMTCFLLQGLSAAETLLRISTSFGKEWFPATVGYAIARTMFETDVTAHYVSKSPTERVRRYIEYAAILNKREMDACKEHRNSKNPQWREAMDVLWKHHWSSREQEVTASYDAAVAQFARVNGKGKTVVFHNWSGITLRQMAEEVEHIEAYDLFYAELSSFAHADVRSSNRYLRVDSNGPIWSQRANEYDVANVFRHAASFLTCYLELFGAKFGVWAQDNVSKCWVFE